MQLEFSVLCNEVRHALKTDNVDLVGIFRNLYIKGKKRSHGYGVLFARVLDMPKGIQTYGIRLRGENGYDMLV